MTEPTNPGPEEPENHARYVVPGLERGLRVLEAVASEERGLTASEVASRIGINRSSAFRLIYTLRHLRFLETGADGRSHRLGPRILNLGFAYLNGQSLIQVAREPLQSLRDATGITAHLVIRDGRDVLFLDCVPSRRGFLTTFNTGTRLPAHATPLGWLLLSDLSSRIVAELYRGVALSPRTEQTPADVPALLRRIAEVGACGYVVSHGIVDPGGCSVAAPVIDRDGRVAAAIDISGPDSAFRLAEMETFYVPEVVKAAQAVSERLGTVPTTG